MESTNFSVVFARLLFHEDLRLKSGAATFARTDEQLMAECSLGKHEFFEARNLICGPNLALFDKTLHGLPAINHYRGNHDRIHIWLSQSGLYTPAQDTLADPMPAPSLPETG